MQFCLRDVYAANPHDNFILIEEKYLFKLTKLKSNKILNKTESSSRYIGYAAPSSTTQNIACPSIMKPLFKEQNKFQTLLSWKPEIVFDYSKKVFEPRNLRKKESIWA